MKGADILAEYIQKNGHAAIADKYCKNQIIYIDHMQRAGTPLSAYNDSFRIDLLEVDDNSNGAGDKYLRADSYTRKAKDNDWIKEEQTYMDKIERFDSLENQLVRLLNLFAFLEEYQLPAGSAATI